MSRQSKYTGRFEAGPAGAEKQTAAGTQVSAGKRISAGIVLLLFLLIGIARLGTEAFRIMGYYDLFLGGKGLLRNRGVTSVDISDSISDALVLDDGTTIIYNGHTYRLNKNLATVLFLGIDQTITEEDTLYGAGGQCDVILLAGMDTKTGEATLLNISREAYAQVEVFSASGIYMETRYEQLALAYAYGNGRDTSCENAERAVSRLLYGLPIGSYVAIDMDGVLEANEAVGGVTLSSLIDYEGPDGISFQKGKKVELHGKTAERYIRYRSHNLYGNVNRMERQKQYLTEFSKQVVKQSKKNITFPVKLFSSLSSYMATSLTVPDVTFLSRCFLKNGAHFTFRSVGGNYDLLNGSAVCYLDEVDLFEAILQVFYVQVD